MRSSPSPRAWPTVRLDVEIGAREAVLRTDYGRDAGDALIGVRERARMYGAVCEAGPREGGFRTVVRLPL